jgi:hypothetical protein
LHHFEAGQVFWIGQQVAIEKQKVILETGGARNDSEQA